MCGALSQERENTQLKRQMLTMSERIANVDKLQREVCSTGHTMRSFVKMFGVAVLQLDECRRQAVSTAEITATSIRLRTEVRAAAVLVVGLMRATELLIVRLAHSWRRCKALWLQSVLSVLLSMRPRCNRSR